jgi:hypothetical protein
MNSKISERFKVNSEVLAPTSAAGATSLNYDMQGFDRAMVSVCLNGTNAAAFTVDLMESSGATIAGTSAAGGKTALSLGGVSTAITAAGGVRAIKLTHSADTTSESFRMALGSGGFKTFTYTSSTALLNSSAWASTLAYYGSTVASSANTGSQFACDSLKTALASTITFGNVFEFSTGSTATLGIKLLDNATGSIVFSNVNSSVVPLCEVNAAVGAFDIQAEDFTSTAGKRYLSVKVSSVSTGVGRAGVSVIRYSDNNPPAFPGVLSS